MGVVLGVAGLTHVGDWGLCREPCVPGETGNTCDVDFDYDCLANAFDLAILLDSWGPVP